MNKKYPDADLAKVEKAAEAFIVRADELFGFYSDSTTGFLASMIQLKNTEAKWKAQSPNANFDSERVSFGSGNWRNPASRILHETTVGELRRRNSDGGLNHIRAAQNFLVLLYSFWEEEHRSLITEALGIKPAETKKCESCKRKLPGSKTDLKVPVIGDVRLLRNDIIHHRGILKQNTFDQLEALHLKRGIDLVSGLRFARLAADQEIRFFPPDVYFLLTLLRKAMDEVVIDAGGKDPNYRAFKKVPA